MGGNTAAIIGGAVNVGASIATMVGAIQQKEEAEGEAQIQKEALASLQKSRQDIVNPYESITNQYANLGVATQAAEFQAEEADIALANTLDTIRASGYGAGGATALAMAAAKSKREVSASLETQEVNNQQLRAEGQMKVDELKARGKDTMWLRQEERDLADLDRTQSLLDTANAQVGATNAALWGAVGNIGSAAMSTGFNMSGNNAKSKETTAYEGDPFTGSLLDPNAFANNWNANSIVNQSPITSNTPTVPTIESPSTLPNLSQTTQTTSTGQQRVWDPATMSWIIK